VRECPKEGGVKCANCGQSHTASFGGCLAAKNAKKVEKIRTTQGLTYSEAVRATRENNPLPAPTAAVVTQPRTDQTKLFQDVGCHTTSVDQATQTTVIPGETALISSDQNQLNSRGSHELLDSAQSEDKFCALLIKILNDLCNIPSVMSGDSKNQGQIVSSLVGEVDGTQIDAVKITKHLVRQKTPRLRSEGDSDSGSGTELSHSRSGTAGLPKASSSKPPQGKKKKGRNGSGSTAGPKS
jgi:hypothetical protein